MFQLTVCLDNGEFYSNFLGCAECLLTNVLHMENRVVQQADDEEIITYERMCLWLIINVLILYASDTVHT